MRRLSIVGVVALLASLFIFVAAGHAASRPQPAPDSVNVLIAFDRQPGRAEEAILRAAGGTIKYTYHLVPAIAAALPQAAIDGLLRNPRVLRIEPDIAVHAVDAELDNAWGVKRIGAGAVHDSGNKGAGVKVAVIDTGIDYTHPDLNANYGGGYDFVNDDTNPMDDHGHGTHVAGTVAAEDDGAGVVGVAPAAVLYALKVLSASGSGSYSDVIAALQWSVDHGIQVTNNSYGSTGDPGATVKAAFDNAEAAGVLNVAAAGNSGNPAGKGDNVIYPARYASTVAIAATNQDDRRASFSSTGPDVELAAPGVSINSTLPGGGYDAWSGTSMATPHVAGTAALVIASGIADANGNGRVNDDVRLRLQQTADDLGAAGRDSHYGFGLVDADEAAGIAVPPPNAAPTVSWASPANGATVNGTVLLQIDASDAEDPAGTLTVQYQVDAGAWQAALYSSFSGYYEASWDTTAVSDGQHNLTARATDSASQTAVSSISVTVSNGPGATVSVASVTPSSMQAGTAIAVNIAGSGFQSGASVSFQNGDGPAPSASSVVVVDANTITAQVTAKSGGPPHNRLWDVRVTNPDLSSGVLVDGLTVTP